MVQLLLLPFDLNILALVGMCVEKQHQNSCGAQLALPLPLRLSLHNNLNLGLLDH